MVLTQSNHSPGSNNETLTALRFQTHQTPTMKCSENMGACYDCQSCICLALGSLTSPLELCIMH